MLTVTDWLNNVTEYTYNDAGYLTLAELPNGVAAEYGYDSADRLTSVLNEGPAGVLSSFTYTLDDVGNRTQVVTPEGTETYTYDDLYRLTGVTYPDSTSESFSYDAVGNRTATAVLAYTYDDADQMLTAGSSGFDYDSNGNQIERGSDTLSYDHENRLVGGTFGSTSVSMAYDGDGLRQSLTEGSQTNDFVWDVASGLPVILEDDSAAYVYGLDLISSVDGSSVEMYYSYDGLGSVANLSSGNGQTTVSYTYRAFGEVRTQTATPSNDWLFTGEQRDTPSAFHYLRARYYDPVLGRFTTRDPFKGLLPDPLSQQPYAYVRSNPVNLVDPFGLDHCEGQVFCQAPCHDGYKPSEVWPDECASPGEGDFIEGIKQYFTPSCVSFGLGVISTGLFAGSTVAPILIVPAVATGFASVYYGGYESDKEGAGADQTVGVSLQASSTTAGFVDAIQRFAGSPNSLARGASVGSSLASSGISLIQCVDSN